MSGIKENIENFLFHCQYEKNLSSKTIKAYSGDLQQFSKYLSDNFQDLDILAVDKFILRNYLKLFFDTYKPKSVKRKVATLKVFFSYLEFDEIIETNPFRKMALKIKEGKALPKTIDLTKIIKLFKYLYTLKNKSNHHDSFSYRVLLRDIAVLELLFATGMRVSELSHLKKENYNATEGFVIINGKGNKERIIPICDQEIKAAIGLYINQFRSEIKKSGYLFVNRLNNRLSEQSIRLMIQKHSKLSKLDQHITPHMFRHSVATLLLENGVDIRFIQVLLGHSSINTTQIYTQVNQMPQRKFLSEKHPRGKFRAGESNGIMVK